MPAPAIPDSPLAKEGLASGGKLLWGISPGGSVTGPLSGWKPFPAARGGFAFWGIE